MENRHPEDLVTIGRVVGSRGRHGLIKVLPITGFPEKIPAKGEVWLWREDTGARLFTVLGGEDRGGHIALRLEGVEDIGAARDLKGSLVMVDEDNMEPLPEDTYYQHQLIGLEVLKEDGVRLGEVTSIMATGAADVYVIRDGEREMMLPAVKEFILGIDLEEGTMLVRPPRGLEEIG